MYGRLRLSEAETSWSSECPDPQDVTPFHPRGTSPPSSRQRHMLRFFWATDSSTGKMEAVGRSVLCSLGKLLLLREVQVTTTVLLITLRCREKILGSLFPPLSGEILQVLTVT